jgi:hyperosmotically inducible protein
VSAAGAGPTEVPSTVQARAAGGNAENSDRLITAQAQSQIGAANGGLGTFLNVTTVNGVVILTGSASSTEALDRVKQSVQTLKNVKGVDATAVRIAGS